MDAADDLIESDYHWHLRVGGLNAAPLRPWEKPNVLDSLQLENVCDLAGLRY